MTKRKKAGQKRAGETVEWLDLTFTWYPDKKSYRVVRERVAEDDSVAYELIGWFSGSLDDAKRSAFNVSADYAVEEAREAIADALTSLQEQLRELSRLSAGFQVIRREMTQKPGAKERRRKSPPK